jgi:hypothetical protein
VRHGGLQALLEALAAFTTRLGYLLELAHGSGAEGGPGSLLPGLLARATEQWWMAEDARRAGFYADRRAAQQGAARPRRHLAAVRPQGVTPDDRIHPHDAAAASDARATAVAGHLAHRPGRARRPFHRNTSVTVELPAGLLSDLIVAGTGIAEVLGE